MSKSVKGIGKRKIWARMVPRIKEGLKQDKLYTEDPKIDPGVNMGQITALWAK